MDVYLRQFAESDLVCPFDIVEWDCNTQTGGDWYMMMLSASLGGKNIEGFSASGTSELVREVNYDFAKTNATGMIKYNKRVKAVDALDEAGDMVAKVSTEFCGITKANNFSLVTEDSLWSSAGTNRVKSAAFLATSLVAMGVSSHVSAEIASDVLGETLPEEVMEAVVVPLSALKRDAALLAKGRNSLFISQHIIQDIAWED